jgi:hypothetical protein
MYSQEMWLPGIRHHPLCLSLVAEETMAHGPRGKPQCTDRSEQGCAHRAGKCGVGGGLLLTEATLTDVPEPKRDTPQTQETE